MPESLGSFVNSETDGIAVGKPSFDGDTKSTAGNSGTIGEPEIIHGFETESPSTERFGSSDGGQRRTKSGKPDGRSSRWQRGKQSGATEEKTSIHLSSISIAGLLLGIHAMGASILKTPELKIEEKEAEALSKAAQDVAACYNHVIDPKVAAWIQLCVVCGGIYGPRVVAIRMREQMEKESRKLKIAEHPASSSPVFQMPEPMNGGLN